MSGENMFNSDFFPTQLDSDISEYLIVWQWRYKLWPIWSWPTHQHSPGGIYRNC